jgi:hypothetical protein
MPIASLDIRLLNLSLMKLFVIKLKSGTLLSMYIVPDRLMYDLLFFDF